MFIEIEQQSGTKTTLNALHIEQICRDGKDGKASRIYIRDNTYYVREPYDKLVARLNKL